MSPDDRQVEPEWFRDWFGDEYLELYPHRDDAEAGRAVNLFRRVAGGGSGLRVLDLACGAGRHLAALREAGFAPVGVDLSWPLLHRARENRPEVPLVRADMRGLPFRDGAFSAVVSFFTSFGYFDDERDDLRVATEVRRVLQTGGAFLIDFLNAAQVRASLVSEDELRIGGRTVRQTRRIRDGRVIKHIEIGPRESGSGPAVFHERVRLYEPEELAALLRRGGLRPRKRFGDYDGSTFKETSPRLIVAGTA